MRRTFTQIACRAYLLWHGKYQKHSSTQTNNPDKGTKENPPGHVYRDYQHPTEEEHRTAEQFSWRASKNLNIWVGIAATIAAIFAGFSWWETKRQANIAQDTLNEIRNSSTQTDQAIAASQKSANAAVELAERARDTEIEQLRPYVFFSNVDIPRTLQDGTIFIRRRLTNTGKSIANDMKRDMRFGWYQLPLPGDGAGLPYPNDLHVATLERSQYMAPGDVLNAGSELIGDIARQFPHWQQDALQGNTRGYLYVEWGTVLYTDIFGRVHHIWLCHTWNGRDQTMINCIRGNRID